MDSIKLVWQKLAHGLIIGIGVGIALGIIIAILSSLKNNDYFNDKSINKVKITKHHEIVRKGVSTFLGTVKNNADDTVRGFQLKVDLYDLNGTFVDQCEEYMSTLATKKETNFKITCKKCEDNKTIKHESYKIYINNY